MTNKMIVSCYWYHHNMTFKTEKTYPINIQHLRYAFAQIYIQCVQNKTEIEEKNCNQTCVKVYSTNGMHAFHIESIGTYLQVVMYEAHL